MKNWWQIFLLGLMSAIFPNDASAQIIPDNTVGTQVTPEVNINGILSDRVDGGSIQGSNLFHSFTEFNIDAVRGVYFTNPDSVTNIFTRVTGTNPSNINGTLGVLGNAHLFFLNPNGIIFGSAAKLDVKGSFVGTTANSINFADSTYFSVSNPQTTPLLTVSVPVGLGFGLNPALLVNRSRATDSTGQVVGLQVPRSQTLGLIGGEIIMAGGYLTSPSGRIELGSVGAGNSVSLTPTNNGFVMGYSNVQNFQNIKLSDAALVSTSGAKGGDIQVFGQEVSLRDGSQILAQTQGSQPGGTLLVRASELVELSGTAPDASQKTADGLIASGLITTTLGSGNANSVIIDTKRLMMTGGAVINTITFGAGNAGSVTVNASDWVEVDGIAYAQELLDRKRLGTVQWFDIRNGIRTETWNSGNGGDITISTLKLIGRNGAQITSGSAIRGNAGSLTVNARDAIELRDFSPDGRLSTTLISGTLGTGKGNNLTVNTKQLMLVNGGGLNSGTSGAGAGGNLTVNAEELVEMTGARSNLTSGAGLIRVPGQSGKASAGNATINTRQLIVRNGAQIFTATGGESVGGSLTINASEKVQVSGVSPDGKLISGILGDARSSGNAGNVRIKTGNLVVSDRGRVAVDSSGTGNAGNLEIVADSIKLKNAGTINAATRSGEGGNIILQTQELQLRNNSSITATAGSNGNGGNITINADAVVQLQDSDVTANAVQGKGGNINITTQGIFPSFDSNITASSQLGINGVVNITTPEIKQENALQEQANKFVSADAMVASGCLARRNTNQGRFVVTGNGGLPETPHTQDIPYQMIQVRSVTSVDNSTLIQKQRKAATSIPSWKLGDPIQEAAQLVTTADGHLLLTTHPNKVALPQNLTCEANQTGVYFR